LHVTGCAERARADLNFLARIDVSEGQAAAADADEDDPALGRRDRRREGERAVDPDEVDDRIDAQPALVAARICSAASLAKESKDCFAPMVNACSRLSGSMSIAMTVASVRVDRYLMANCPSPPAPMTATLRPAPSK
jgi:hypothetical protein